MRQKKEASEKKLVDVSIPRSLFERLKKRVEETEFRSVSDYVTYVLGELVAENVEKEEFTSKRDEERIKARLKSLGYVD